MKLTSFFFLALALTGCHTLHFKRVKTAPTTYEIERWHHIGVVNLVEFSDPVHLTDICGSDQWESVSTRTGPYQIAARLSLLYWPEAVLITCSEPSKAQATQREKSLKKRGGS